MQNMKNEVTLVVTGDPDNWVLYPVVPTLLSESVLNYIQINNEDLIGISLGDSGQSISGGHNPSYLLISLKALTGTMRYALLKTQDDDLDFSYIGSIPGISLRVTELVESSFADNSDDNLEDSLSDNLNDNYLTLEAIFSAHATFLEPLSEEELLELSESEESVIEESVIEESVIEESVIEESVIEEVKESEVMEEIETSEDTDQIS